MTAEGEAPGVELVPVERIVRAVHVVRGERVLLDEDLAELYGVETGALNRAVTRNAERFPADFAFRLTAEEWADLKCQFGISSEHGGRRKLPRAFTEQGVAMLSGVLRSKRAVAVNVEIMRTFVRLRRLLATHEDLAARLDDLEHRTAAELVKVDAELVKVWKVLKMLVAPPSGSGRRIGFGAGDASGPASGGTK